MLARYLTLQPSGDQHSDDRKIFYDNINKYEAEILAHDEAKKVLNKLSTDQRKQLAHVRLPSH